MARGARCGRALSSRVCRCSRQRVGGKRADTGARGGSRVVGVGFEKKLASKTLDNHRNFWYIWSKGIQEDNSSAHNLTSPSAVVVANTLRERVLNGEYRDGSWLPTERELAEEFGVSRTIIRWANEDLERQNLVVRSPRCRPIVRRPNASSVQRDTKRLTLGLWIWPSATFPGAAAILRGIYKTLDADCYRLIVESPVDTDWRLVVHSESQFLERITRDGDIAGVFLWYLGGEASLSMLQHVRSAGIPLVFLDRLPP
ncbi:MAG: GntR family transcriptional regulator [Armatimonadota bacterium]